MTKWIIIQLILTAAGGAFAVSILTRLLPNEKLKKWFGSLGNTSVKFFMGLGKGIETGGKILTGFGTFKFGKAFWEKFEDFLENSVEICYYAFMEQWRVNLTVNLFEYYWKSFRKGLDYDKEKTGGQGTNNTEGK